MSSLVSVAKRNSGTKAALGQSLPVTVLGKASAVTVTENWRDGVEPIYGKGRSECGGGEVAVVLVMKN